jgi:hypothetical protein
MVIGHRVNRKSREVVNNSGDMTGPGRKKVVEWGRRI